MILWPWRYRSRSKVAAHSTTSHASDHLCHIGKESFQNCTCSRVDTTRCAIFSQFYCKIMAEWPLRYWSRSKSLHPAHPLMLVIVCDKYWKNPSRNIGVADLTRNAGQTDGWSETNIPPPTLCVAGITRTTRTPVFWGYPPLPHDYPYYWFILDPKSIEDKVKVTNLKNSPKFQMLKIQRGHDSVHRRTDGRTEKGETSIPPFQLCWSGGYNKGLVAWGQKQSITSKHNC